MHTRVEMDQYGPRGKSRWIREALIAMLEDDPRMLMVAVGDALEFEIQSRKRREAAQGTFGV